MRGNIGEYSKIYAMFPKQSFVQYKLSRETVDAAIKTDAGILASIQNSRWRTLADDEARD